MTMGTDLEPEHMRKIFIGGLHPDTTDESLRTYFEKYGEIVDCIVMRDGQTRRSRGFGFVAFNRSDCVDRLQEERPHVLDGKEVDTKRVVPKSGPTSQPRNDREQKVNKVFIGGLKEEINEEDMRSFFSQFGEVDKIETFTDKETGRRKGFGFVTFVDFDSADKCVLQGQTVDGKLDIMGYKVEVKKARSQEEMKNMNAGRGGRGGSFGGGRGGSRGGGGRFGNYGGGGGGGGRDGYSDYNQGYSQGYSNGGGYGGGGGGYGGGSGGYGGGSYSGGGSGYSGGGGGYGNGGGYGGGDGYGGGGSYNNSGYGGGSGGGWSGSGGSGGGYSQNGGSGGPGPYGSGYSGGSGGGPMRGGYNRNRPGPYSGGGGGGGGWRN